MLFTGDPIDAHDGARVRAREPRRPGGGGRGGRDARAPRERDAREPGLEGDRQARLLRQMDLDLEAAYAEASEVMAASSQTDDAREGMAAFLEKRPPRYPVR